MRSYLQHIRGIYKNNAMKHGLRTPNEGINQRNLKFWADVADKICFGRTYKFGIGIWFSAVQWRRFPHRVFVVRGLLRFQIVVIGKFAQFFFQTITTEFNYHCVIVDNFCTYLYLNTCSLRIHAKDAKTKVIHIFSTPCLM